MLVFRIVRPVLIGSFVAALAGCSHGPPRPPPAAAAGAPKGTPAHKAKFSGDTLMGALLDDPAARAVLQRHIPKVVASGQISMARGLSLKQLAGFAQAGISPKVLGEIEADLAKLN